MVWFVKNQGADNDDHDDLWTPCQFEALAECLWRMTRRIGDTGQRPLVEVVDPVNVAVKGALIVIALRHPQTEQPIGEIVFGKIASNTEFERHRHLDPWRRRLYQQSQGRASVARLAVVCAASMDDHPFWPPRRYWKGEKLTY